jgi:hypothetical protein
MMPQLQVYTAHMFCEQNGSLLISPFQKEVVALFDFVMKEMNCL